MNSDCYACGKSALLAVLPLYHFQELGPGIYTCTQCHKLTCRECLGCCWNSTNVYCLKCSAPMTKKLDLIKAVIESRMDVDNSSRPWINVNDSTPEEFNQAVEKNDQRMRERILEEEKKLIEQKVPQNQWTYVIRNYYEERPDNLGSYCYTQADAFETMDLRGKVGCVPVDGSTTYACYVIDGTNMYRFKQLMDAEISRNGLDPGEHEKQMEVVKLQNKLASTTISG